MKQPEQIANNILGLIDKDITKIEEEFSGLRLDPDTALTLTRYLKAVFDAKSDRKEDEKLHRDKLSKLSTEELNKMALEIIQNKNKKDNA